MTKFPVRPAQAASPGFKQTITLPAAPVAPAVVAADCPPTIPCGPIGVVAYKNGTETGYGPTVIRHVTSFQWIIDDTSGIVFMLSGPIPLASEIVPFALMWEPDVPGTAPPLVDTDVDDDDFPFPFFRITVRKGAPDRVGILKLEYRIVCGNGAEIEVPLITVTSQ